MLVAAGPTYFGEQHATLMRNYNKYGVTISFVRASIFRTADV